MSKIVYTPYAKPSKKKRPGIHAKTKQSKSKGSLLYVKAYKGQGR